MRHLLPSIQVLTLVLCRSGDQVAGPEHADILMYLGDSDAVVDEVEEFLTGTRHAPETDRVLATVLFIDMVGSTERAAQLGDRRWGDLLARLAGLAAWSLRLWHGRGFEVGDERVHDEDR